MGIETGITVHYWAAAKAATGVSGEVFDLDGEVSLSGLVERVVAAHPGQKVADVIAVCSVLLDDQPVSSRDPGAVRVRPGQTVEFLPPFAGG
ncbi:MAG: MoaD/ThiS family protein [Nocardioides sp.]|uniref:MoaD/ThiS family protein n=1 Tax=Nocardioides sp. TaxID=35761 RepID=UPI003F037112